MEISKIFTLLCAFLLVICLVLSITALMVMRNAVAEADAWEERAAALITDLDACIQNFKSEQDQAVLAPITPDDSETSESGFFLRAEGETVGVFTTEGYRVCECDVLLSTLPPQERARLEKGIYAKTWVDAMRLMQDYQA